VKNESERMWKQVVTTKFEALSSYFPGGSEENFKVPQSRKQALGARSEPGKSWMRRKSAATRLRERETVMKS
jgi:hypothetical protein